MWYDESELGGGDAWDQKIRRQIRECDYFMPLISAHTEARHEGYFRGSGGWPSSEPSTWPTTTCFSAGRHRRARISPGRAVPEKFLAVQWLRVPGGQTSPALEALCRRLVSGESQALSAPRRSAAAPALSARAAPGPAVPAFPREVPGQRVRFWFEVGGWALRSAGTQWRRLRPWLRVLIIIWLAFLFVTRGCVSRHHETEGVSPATAARIRSIADQYQGGGSPVDATQLAAQIAHEFTPEVPAASGAAQRVHILVVPFAAPAGDAAAGKFADSALAQVYGRIAIRTGHLGMAKDSLPACDLAGMLERGRRRTPNSWCAARSRRRRAVPDSP